MSAVCTCNQHSRTQPGYVSCHVDHEAIAERNAAMRALLLASPKFREEAFAHEGTQRISEASDEDLVSVRFLVVDGYIDWLVARACVKASWGESSDLIENGVLTSECADYGINLFPTGGASGLGAAGGGASQIGAAA